MTIGGRTNDQAAQKEWSRRFTPARIPAAIADAMATSPQMTIHLTMLALSSSRALCHVTVEHQVAQQEVGCNYGGNKCADDPINH